MGQNESAHSIEFCRRIHDKGAREQRGEFVVMIAPDTQKEEGVSDEASNLLHALADELPPRKAAQIVADHYGLKSRDLYQLLIDRE